MAFWGVVEGPGESACVDRRSTFPQRFTDDQLEPGRLGRIWKRTRRTVLCAPSRFGIKGRGSETFLFAGGARNRLRTSFVGARARKRNGWNDIEWKTVWGFPTTHKRVYLFFHAVTPMLELGWRKFFFDELEEVRLPLVSTVVFVLSF